MIPYESTLSEWFWGRLQRDISSHAEKELEFSNNVQRVKTEGGEQPGLARVGPGVGIPNPGNPKFSISVTISVL